MKIFGLIVLFFVAAALAAATLAYAAPLRGMEPPEGSNTASSKESDSAKMKGPRFSSSAYDITPLSKERIDALAIKLTPADAEVILAKGTERAFCGNLLDNKKEGVYVCKLCGLPLFSSKAKFNSGTGWPSFFQPFDKDHVAVKSDTSHGMVRDEDLTAAEQKSSKAQSVTTEHRRNLDSNRAAMGSLGAACQREEQALGVAG